MNTPYSFTSFKPVSFCGDFVEKGTQFSNNPSVAREASRSWVEKLGRTSGQDSMLSSYGDAPEVWSGANPLIKKKKKPDFEAMTANFVIEGDGVALWEMKEMEELLFL